MRGLFVLIGLSALLAGCITQRELPGREPFWKTAETAQSLGLLTPAVAKECSDHLAREFPKIKTVGPFSISALAAYVKAERQLTFTMMRSEDADNTVAVIAPASTEHVLGDSGSVIGCLYRLRDNRLFFEKAKGFGVRNGDQYTFR